MGNTDAGLLSGEPDPGHGEVIADIDVWCAERLDARRRALVSAYAPTVRVELGSGDALLCFHGSPRSHHDVIVATTSDDELGTMLGGAAAAVLAAGHTHEALVRRWRSAILVNPGSVGMPVEHVPPAPPRNPPWAEWALVDREHGAVSISLRRTALDVSALLADAGASGMPHVEAWAEDWR
jgi:hypothetical protein